MEKEEKDGRRVTSTAEKEEKSNLKHKTLLFTKNKQELCRTQNKKN